MCEEHFGWLQNRVEAIVRACRSEGPTGLPVYYPAAGGEMYGAFYLREFTYMVESVPEFIPAADIRQALEAFLRGIREDGVCPEKLGLEGEPFYVCHGPLPAADSAPFLVKLANAHLEMTGDLALLEQHFARLRKGLEAVPTDDASGLVWIDPARPHTAYGFADTIARTGKVLFCSLLMAEAWEKMSDFAAKLDRREDAQDSARLAEALESASAGTGEAALCDLVDEFRENGIWECIGRDGYQRLSNNASSVVLPYAAFKRIRSERPRAGAGQ